MLREGWKRNNVFENLLTSKDCCWKQSTLNVWHSANYKSWLLKVFFLCIYDQLILEGLLLDLLGKGWLHLSSGLCTCVILGQFGLQMCFNARKSMSSSLCMYSVSLFRPAFSMCWFWYTFGLWKHIQLQDSCKKYFTCEWDYLILNWERNILFINKLSCIYNKDDTEIYSMFR